jgi:hypothetical protein
MASQNGNGNDAGPGGPATSPTDQGGEAGATIDRGDAGASETPDANATCATGQSTAVRYPVYVDILLDGSRSMDGHGGPTANQPCDLTADTDTDAADCFLSGGREADPSAPTRDILVCHKEANSDTAGMAANNCPGFVGLTGKKWLAARGAIDAYVDDLSTNPNPKLGVGLFLFSSTDVKAPTQWDVPIAMVDPAHAGAIKARIAPGTWPAGGTPMKATIEGQAQLLRSFTAQSPLEGAGTRVLLLMTDGVPNGSSTKQDVIDVVTAAKNGSPSILTYVVGLGDTNADEDTVYDEKFLSALAAAGGAAPQGCNPAWDGQNPSGVSCHLQVTPGTKASAQIRTEIESAIDSMSQTVQSCDFALAQTAAIDPTHVNVVLKTGQGQETQIAPDPATGWTFDNDANPTKVVLHGAACDAVHADPATTVQVVVGCKTGDPIR